MSDLRPTSASAIRGLERVDLDLHAFADALPYAIFTADAGGAAEHFNAAWYALTGSSTGDSVGSGWLGAIHHEDFAAAVAAWERSCAMGEPYDVRHRIRSRDGTFRLMHGRATAVRQADGKIVKWVATYVDVHDAAEHAARWFDADFRYRALLDQLPANIWTARPDGEVDSISPAWTSLTGWGAEAVPQETWLGLVHPDDRERVRDTWRSAVSTGSPYEAAFRYQNRRSGYYEAALSKAVAVRDSAGAIVQWIGITTDQQQRARNAAAFRLLTEVGAACAARREEMLSDVLRAAVPLYADAGIIEIVSGDGALLEIASEGAAEAISALRAASRVERVDGIVSRAVRTALPVTLETLSGPLRSLICATVDEPPKVGVMLLGRAPATPPFESADVDVMHEIASRIREFVFP